MTLILSHDGVGMARVAAGRAPAASASSSRIGAPRLHEWIDITEAHLSTKSISSRVAPAASAARMWRRVPSGLRLVQAAFNPTLTSSMNLRDSTPLVHGFVVIVTQVSAQAGSHCRSCSRAGSHGPDVCCCSTTDVLSVSLVSMAHASSVAVPVVSCILEPLPVDRGEVQPQSGDWTLPDLGCAPQGEGAGSLQDAG